MTAINSSLIPHSSSLMRGRYCNLCGRGMPPGLRSEVQLPGENGAPERWTVCESCRQTWLRCASCGRTLGGHNEPFLLVPEARRFYCEDCWNRPRCDTCGLPLGTVSYARPDGRRMCDRCHLTAIYDHDKALTLYSRVERTLQEVIGLRLAVGAHFHLVNHDQLLELADRHAANPLENDARQRCFGLFLRDGRLRVIYVEYGLPQIVFCEVAAHEYAHVWQAENCPLLTDIRVREGFAEWAAYKVLEYWGCRRRLAHFRQRTDLYGQGLQLMLRWEAEGGVDTVLNRVRDTR